MIAVGKIAEAIGIRGGIAIAFALAFIGSLFVISAKNSKIESVEAALLVSEANHNVTANSLDVLTRRMEELVEAGQLRESLLEEAMEQAESEASELQDEADALRKEGVGDQCVTPTGVLRSRGL